MSRTRHTDKEKTRIIREFEQHDGSAAADLPNPEHAPAFLEFQLRAQAQWPAPADPLVELELGGGIILRIYPARLIH